MLHLMFCFRECLLLCVADHVTAKFMLGKSQACLTYVVLQPRGNKYFSYFPSSTVRLMGVFFPASSHSLFLWAPFSFTQFDKRNRLFQITLLWTKISVSSSSPLLQYLQSHQGDLKKKKKKAVETSIQTFVQLEKKKIIKPIAASEADDRCMCGKCTQVHACLCPYKSTVQDQNTMPYILALIQVQI